MSSAPGLLDPLQVPLSGVQLIEASAGTGKTYTIATLYLRLLIESALEVDRILVVTFTNAATEELRGRVRGRIREALAALAGGTSPPAGSPLSTLLSRGGNPGRLCERLHDALIRLDESAVFTIHGFCQRMLQENAFESGALFEAELLGSDTEIRRAVSEDFWRLHFQSAALARVEWARQRWASPTDLLTHLSALLSQPGAPVAPDDAGAVDELEQEMRLAYDALGEAWRQGRAEVLAVLGGAPGLRRAADSYRPDRIVEAAGELDRWLSDGFSLVVPAGSIMFTRAKLEGSLKKGGAAPEHPFFETFQAYAERARELDRRLRIGLYTAARSYFGRELATRKARDRVMAFDDLLVGLDRALSGPGGERLAGVIRRRFPVAMIDEFQDTDPVQYQIFRLLYRGQPGCGLFLIGDPKQAIYGFRGADIFTYAQARRETPTTCRHTLGVNWRSASGMVEGVNRLFARADPFLFEPDIVFQPAEAAGEVDKQPLLVEGLRPAALQLWLAERSDEQGTTALISKQAAERAAVTAFASEAARLVGLGAQGRALIGAERLRAGDIAFLVRNRFEAASVRDALGAHGLASVFHTRDSVFGTPEARDLALVLQAVAQAGDDAALRAALAGDLIGLDAPRLGALAADEGLWEGRLEQFREYLRLWQTLGFMPMWLRLLHGEGIPRRLLAADQGERRLTNLMQLAELLQLAAQDHEGPEGLLRWLADRRADPDGDAEDQQLRLESDEALVQIVTVHKSKGLEYPVVFLPFAWSARTRPCEVPLAFHDPGAGALCFDIGSEELASHHRLAERERLAEDLRLLYVAVSRARYQCHLAWGAIREAEASALGYLLHDGDLPPDDGAMRVALSALPVQAVLLVRPLRAPGPWEGTGFADKAGELEARRFDGGIDGSWRIASYSALVEGRGIAPARAEADQLAEGGLGVEPAWDQSGNGVHRFPAGTQAGLLLHDVLERLSFPDAAGPALAAEVRERLAQYGIDPAWQPVVEHLIGNVLDTALDEAGRLRLRDLDGARRRSEMVFHFPLARLSPDGLGGALGDLAHLELGTERLTFNPVRGLMKGYIDLVFEHAGRYYLADYKSNRLGVRTEDYDALALAAAMREHRYDLQYLIYAVALHRYLHQRLSGYNYARHFGGAYYLFLRGMDPQQGSRYGVFFDRPARALIERLDGLFRGRT